MRGIDLSHWNGEMGSKIIRDSKVELDFIIAKHSEGGTIKDTMFHTYYKLSQDRGVIFEPYHFYVGNNFTSNRREDIVAILFQMETFSTSGVIWIDWERELDRANFEFIYACINDFKEQGGKCHVGLYASYSVFASTNYTPRGCPADMSLAEFCDSYGILIWCARYKTNAVLQPIEYGKNITPFDMLQPMIGSIPVDVNQITSRCTYKGNEIKLDYDVRFMTCRL